MNGLNIDSEISSIPGIIKCDIYQCRNGSTYRKNKLTEHLPCWAPWNSSPKFGKVWSSRLWELYTGSL